MHLTRAYRAYIRRGRGKQKLRCSREQTLYVVEDGNLIKESEIEKEKKNEI
jgi:hypothetical protein